MLDKLIGDRIRKPCLSTLQDEDPIGRLREDARVSPEGVTLCGERLVPTSNDVVRARAHLAEVHLLCVERG